MRMSPSAGGVAPQHLLPYESELGVVTLDSLIQFVCHMDERPAVPRHWELLPQVFLQRGLLHVSVLVLFYLLSSNEENVVDTP